MDAQAQTERAAGRVGKLLKEKWRLDQLIGVGGMAAVYAATHRNGKRVAVKMLHPEISVDDDVRRRFLREGYAANAVGHRGAVQVDDDDVTEDGAAFLVMELLQGETLDARAGRKGGTLPVAEVLSLCDQVLDTLAAAHSKDIIHRDLKPENLFMTREGTVKVLDFGIARLREMSGKSASTQSGAVMGTPAFMAPEQAKSRWDEVDARTDLWAIGATMFHLLTSRYVHEADTVTEALALAVMWPARSIGSVDPSLPPAIVELVDRALAYDKKDRWPSAAAMQEALRTVYYTLDEGSTPHSHRVSFADGTTAELLEIPDEPEVHLPATRTFTGPGVSTTISRGRKSSGALAVLGGIRGVSKRQALVAAVAGAIALVGTIAVLKGGSRPTPIEPGATAASPPSALTAPLPPRPSVVAPEDLPPEQPEVTEPAAAALAAASGDTPRSKTLAKHRPTASVGAPAKPAPAKAVAPVGSKAKPAGDPFSGRF
jgi:serine/threonine-protein kinase